MNTRRTIVETPATVQVCHICELVPDMCSGHRGVIPSMVRHPDGSPITKPILENTHRENNKARAETCKRLGVK